MQIFGIFRTYVVPLVMKIYNAAVHSCQDNKQSMYFQMVSMVLALTL